LRLRYSRMGQISRLLDFEPLTMCNPDSKSVRTAFANESNANLSALSRLQTDGAKRLLHLLSRVCTGILLWLVLSSTAFASCTPPPKMMAKIEAKASAETFANLGTWFGNQKQFACAADAYASAVKMQPDSESYQYMLGLSLYSAGRSAEAEEPLRKAARLNSSDVRPHLALAAALDMLKRIADAEAEWRAALAIDPDSETALDALSQDLINEKDYTAVVTLLGKPAETRVRSSRQSLNLGIAYASTARLNDASEVLRGGLNTAPDSLPLAVELALVLKLLSRDGEAYTVFELALQHHPADFDTQLLYCRVLVSGHSDKAPQLAHKLLLAHPNNWEVLYLNSVLETQDGDFKQARVHLERSVALNPNDSKSQRALGDVLSRLQDLQGAKNHLEKAIALGDSSPEVQYELAKVLQSLGDRQQAQDRLRVYQQVKKAQADRVQAAGNAEVGDQAMAAGDAVKAVQLYRAALATDPDEPILSYKLARALDKTNDLVNEKVALEHAIQLNPKLAEAQNQMGYLSARSGDVAAAESYFHAAIDASPSYVAAWINLAATLASESKWHDATQAVDRALEIDPSNAEARQLEQAIQATPPKQ
jgi:tetratricopeptide (TPR) repeat protein